MTTVSVTVPSALKPPFVCVVKADVSYTGGGGDFIANWSVSGGHANSRVVSLNGDWVTNDDYTYSTVDSAETEIYAAVWVWGTSSVTVQCTVDGVSDSDTVTVTADSNTYDLVTPNVIINDQSGLDALIAGGGTSDQVYLRGGIYSSSGTNVLNTVSKIETHPDDWYIGEPAVFAGDGTQTSGSNAQRVWVTTADDFTMRRVFFFDTRWTAFLIQDVDSPLVEQIVFWELQGNGSFSNTTNGIMRDIVMAGAWDWSAGGENANGLVVADTGAASNNLVERCIGLGISDDVFDGWNSQDTTWRHVFGAFAGKDTNGDGVGIKVNGSTAAGGNVLHNSVFYKMKVGVNSNSSTLLSPTKYHSNTVIEASFLDYYFDGGTSSNADVRNCISLNNGQSGSWGAYDSTSNSWDLALTPTLKTTLDPFHLSWEGFEASGFGQPLAASTAIDAGSPTSLVTDVATVGTNPDIGFFEYGTALYTNPSPPTGLTISSGITLTSSPNLSEVESESFLVEAEIDAIGLTVTLFAVHADDETNTTIVTGTPYEDGAVTKFPVTLTMDEVATRTFTYTITASGDTRISSFQVTTTAAPTYKSYKLAYGGKTYYRVNNGVKYKLVRPI